MVADSGASFVLVGHSERRSLFGESDENVGRKTVAVANAGLDVVVCVGETEAERRAALTHEVVERQVRAATAGVAPADRHRVTVAYEPVWAIGTGRTPLGEEIDSVHRWIREVLASQWNAPREANLILYGGSVNPENARAILSLPHVDGALVGGASLESSLFLAIAAAAGLPGPGPA